MKYHVKDKYVKIEINSISYGTIQDFFDALIPSKKYQHLLIQNKWIKIDGKHVQRNSEIKGNSLEILLYPENIEYKIKTDIELTVLYEDELFFVVNKPAGILVHSDGSDKITMVDVVESYFKRNNIYGCVHPIHRLDEETQGVLVFSKSVIFQSLLDTLLSEKQISRKYLAFVEGKIEKGKKISVCEPIARDRHNSKKQRISKNGQYAKTNMQCIASSKKYSVLKCQLETGRTHQIRVHTSFLGHPILHDKLYGHAYKGCKHMGLVSYEMRFYHPLKEEILYVKGKMSEDLERLYKNIERNE